MPASSPMDAKPWVQSSGSDLSADAAFFFAFSRDGLVIMSLIPHFAAAFARAAIPLMSEQTGDSHNSFLSVLYISSEILVNKNSIIEAFKKGVQSAHCFSYNKGMIIFRRRYGRQRKNKHGPVNGTAF